MNLDLRLYQELEQAIGEMLEQHAAELVMGKAVDWADYRFRSGYMKALRDALSVARDVQARVLGVEEKER
jgi:hypothetical protein